MSSRWTVNDKLIWATDGTEGDHLSWSGEIDLPTTIKVKVSGKDLRYDTKISDDGTILQDKFIKIDNIYLAGWPINPNTLQKICFFKNEKFEIENNCFFWCDGEATIEFSENNAVKWHLRFNH